MTDSIDIMTAPPDESPPGDPAAETVNIAVRDLPIEVAEYLRVRAALNGRSRNRLIVDLLCAVHAEYQEQQRESA